MRFTCGLLHDCSPFWMTLTMYTCHWSSYTQLNAFGHKFPRRVWLGKSDYCLHRAFSSLLMLCWPRDWQLMFCYFSSVTKVKAIVPSRNPRAGWASFIGGSDLDLEWQWHWGHTSLHQWWSNSESVNMCRNGQTMDWEHKRQRVGWRGPKENGSLYGAIM